MAMSQLNKKFDALAEAEKLRTAMKGLGTDEATIIQVLGCRPSHQRVEIAKAYKTAFGKDLVANLKTEISGKFFNTCSGLCYYLSEYDAMCLRGAVKGLGTDEQTIIDILTTRNNHQIKAIKTAYKTIYNRNLEADIRSDVSGYFSRVLVSLLTANRDETVNPDPKVVSDDVINLCNAGERRFGTDESVFNRILCSRSFAHVAAIAAEYGRQYTKSLDEVIKSETSGSYRDCLMSIVSFATDPSAHFATVIFKCVHGIGTKDKRLQHAIITQAEGDMQGIKDAMRRLYKNTLEKLVKGDTSGNYRKLLLTLIG